MKSQPVLDSLIQILETDRNREKFKLLIYSFMVPVLGRIKAEHAKGSTKNHS